DINYIYDITLSERLSKDERFRQDNLLHIINTPTTALTEQIMTTLNSRLTTTPIKIDKVWGALEAANIKSLRPQLKSVLGLSRQDMTIQVYWRA
ncbi:MAG: SIP domain-containing protein, partial [Psychrobacter alimentarius]